MPIINDSTPMSLGCRMRFTASTPLLCSCNEDGNRSQSCINYETCSSSHNHSQSLAYSPGPEHQQLSALCSQDTQNGFGSQELNMQAIKRASYTCTTPLLLNLQNTIDSCSDESADDDTCVTSESDFDCSRSLGSHTILSRKTCSSTFQTIAADKSTVSGVEALQHSLNVKEIPSYTCASDNSTNLHTESRVSTTYKTSNRSASYSSSCSTVYNDDVTTSKFNHTEITLDHTKPSRVTETTQNSTVHTERTHRAPGRDEDDEIISSTADSGSSCGDVTDEEGDESYKTSSEDITSEISQISTDYDEELSPSQISDRQQHLLSQSHASTVYSQLLASNADLSHRSALRDTDHISQEAVPQSQHSDKSTVYENIDCSNTEEITLASPVCDSGFAVRRQAFVCKSPFMLEQPVNGEQSHTAVLGDRNAVTVPIVCFSENRMRFQAIESILLDIDRALIITQGNHDDMEAVFPPLVTLQQTASEASSIPVTSSSRTTTVTMSVCGLEADTSDSEAEKEAESIGEYLRVSASPHIQEYLHQQEHLHHQQQQTEDEEQHAEQNSILQDVMALPSVDGSQDVLRRQQQQQEDAVEQVEQKEELGLSTAADQSLDDIRAASQAVLAEIRQIDQMLTDVAAVHTAENADHADVAEHSPTADLLPINHRSVKKKRGKLVRGRGRGYKGCLRSSTDLTDEARETASMSSHSNDSIIIPSCRSMRMSRGRLNKRWNVSSSSSSKEDLVQRNTCNQSPSVPTNNTERICTPPSATPSARLGAATSRSTSSIKSLLLHAGLTPPVQDEPESTGDAEAAITGLNCGKDKTDNVVEEPFSPAEKSLEEAQTERKTRPGKKRACTRKSKRKAANLAMKKIRIARYQIKQDAITFKTGDLSDSMINHQEADIEVPNPSAVTNQPAKKQQSAERTAETSTQDNIQPTETVNYDCKSPAAIDALNRSKVKQIWTHSTPCGTSNVISASSKISITPSVTPIAKTRRLTKLEELEFSDEKTIRQSYLTRKQLNTAKVSGMQDSESQMMLSSVTQPRRTKSKTRKRIIRQSSSSSSSNSGRSEPARVCNSQAQATVTELSSHSNSSGAVTVDEMSQAGISSKRVESANKGNSVVVISQTDNQVAASDRPGSHSNNEERYKDMAISGGITLIAYEPSIPGPEVFSPQPLRSDPTSQNNDPIHYQDQVESKNRRKSATKSSTKRPKKLGKEKKASEKTEEMSDSPSVEVRLTRRSSRRAAQDASERIKSASRKSRDRQQTAVSTETETNSAKTSGEDMTSLPQAAGSNTDKKESKGDDESEHNPPIFNNHADTEKLVKLSGSSSSAHEKNPSTSMKIPTDVYRSLSDKTQIDEPMTCSLDSSASKKKSLMCSAEYSHEQTDEHQSVSEAAIEATKLGQDRREISYSQVISESSSTSASPNSRKASILAECDPSQSITESLKELNEQKPVSTTLNRLSSASPTKEPQPKSIRSEHDIVNAGDETQPASSEQFTQESELQYEVMPTVCSSSDCTEMSPSVSLISQKRLPSSRASSFCMLPTSQVEAESSEHETEGESQPTAREQPVIELSYAEFMAESPTSPVPTTPPTSRELNLTYTISHDRPEPDEGIQTPAVANINLINTTSERLNMSHHYCHDSVYEKDTEYSISTSLCEHGSKLGEAGAVGDQADSCGKRRVVINDLQKNPNDEIIYRCNKLNKSTNRLERSEGKISSEIVLDQAQKTNYCNDNEKAKTDSPANPTKTNKVLGQHTPDDDDEFNISVPETPPSSQSQQSEKPDSSGKSIAKLEHKTKHRGRTVSQPAMSMKSPSRNYIPLEKKRARSLSSSTPAQRIARKPKVSFSSSVKQSTLAPLTPKSRIAAVVALFDTPQPKRSILKTDNSTCSISKNVSFGADSEKDSQADIEPVPHSDMNESKTELADDENAELPLFETSLSPIKSSAVNDKQIYFIHPSPEPPRKKKKSSLPDQSLLFTQQVETLDEFDAQLRDFLLTDSRPEKPASYRYKTNCIKEEMKSLSEGRIFFRNSIEERKSRFTNIRSAYRDSSKLISSVKNSSRGSQTIKFSLSRSLSATQKEPDPPATKKGRPRHKAACTVKPSTASARGKTTRKRHSAPARLTRKPVTDDSQMSDSVDHNDPYAFSDSSALVNIEVLRHECFTKRNRVREQEKMNLVGGALDTTESSEFDSIDSSSDSDASPPKKTPKLNRRVTKKTKRVTKLPAKLTKPSAHQGIKERTRAKTRVRKIEPLPLKYHIPAASPTSSPSPKSRKLNNSTQQNSSKSNDGSMYRGDNSGMANKASRPTQKLLQYNIAPQDSITECYSEIKVEKKTLQNRKQRANRPSVSADGDIQTPVTPAVPSADQHTELEDSVRRYTTPQGGYDDSDNTKKSTEPPPARGKIRSMRKLYNCNSGHRLGSDDEDKLSQSSLSQNQSLYIKPKASLAKRRIKRSLAAAPDYVSVIQKLQL